MSELAVLPKEVETLAQGVSIEKKNEVQTVLNHVFHGVSKMREQLDLVNVEDENDKVNMKLANSIRLGVRSIRLTAEKQFDLKREEVQTAMRSYKTEDALWLKAKQTMQILTKEIEDTAKWKEDTKERILAEKKELKTQTRLLQCKPSAKYIFCAQKIAITFTKKTEVYVNKKKNEKRVLFYSPFMAKKWHESH